MIKLSVIIPVYNAEKYLDECLRSVSNQSYKNIEIIIINDGSTDFSDEIISKWKKNDNRITVISQRNSGVSVARNKGLEIAQGEWVTFVDADDYIASNYFQRVLSIIENQNVQMFTYNMYNSGKYDRKIFSKIEMASICVGNGGALGYVWNKFFQNEIIRKKNIKFDSNISICEDLLFCLEYIQHIKIGIYCMFDIQNLYMYRIHAESATQNIQSNKLVTALEAYQHILELEYLSEKIRRSLYKGYNSIAINCMLLEWIENGGYDKQIRDKYFRIIRNQKMYMSLKDYIKFLIILIAPWFMYKFRMNKL